MSREYYWKSRAYGAARQLSNQLLVKQYWFQLPLCNKTVISCLFGRIVKTMPLGTVDSSMHNCPRPQAIVHLAVHGTSWHSFDYSPNRHEITVYHLTTHYIMMISRN